MRRHWAVPVLASILILTSLGFSQDAFALNTFISDEPSCENAPVFGDFQSGTCVLSGTHTILLHDNWNFEIASKNTGTVDVFGHLQLRVSHSNSGTINVIGDTSGVGNRALLQFNFGTDYTNECNGIINLIGGNLHRNGWLLIARSGGSDPIFNNFGTITGTNSNIPNEIGVILLDGAPITVNNHGTLTAPVLVGQGIFNDNLPDQCSPSITCGADTELQGTECVVTQELRDEITDLEAALAAALEDLENALTDLADALLTILGLEAEVEELGLPGAPVANQGEGKGVPAQGKNNKP